MDDKPVPRALADTGPVPLGGNIRAQPQTLAEAEPEEKDKPAKKIAKY